MNRSALVLASFAADSLALGAHWIYDTGKIDRDFGRIEEPLSPAADSYHKNRNRGEFTHYGDQALLLLTSIARHGGFSLESFAADWRDFMGSYDGYRDKATTHTQAQLGAGADLETCGSTSSDLGGAARIAPLIHFFHEDREALLDAVRQQTRLTHNNPAVLAGAETLARICWQVLRGARPTVAVTDVLSEGIADIDLDLRVRAGLDSLGKPTRETIRSFGQACGIGAALPGAIHLVATYESDLRTALIENVMAGGDSAARGLCVGMILGAYGGEAAIPASWLEAMRATKRIRELLATLG